MAKRDYYEILGVSRNVSEAELKKAYRKAAQKHHPDRNPGDPESERLFKESKEAYEILSDPQRRAAYDQFGHAGIDPSMGAGAAGAGFGGGSFSDIFGDVFGDIFSGARGGGGSRARRGSDLRYNLELSLEEAVHGTTVTITVPSLAPCEVCGGSGAKKGTSPMTCPTCHGHGQVRMQQGFFSLQQTCPRCHGIGQVIPNPCSACRGSGRTEKQKNLSVKVPAGVDNGDRIRLTGEGEAGELGGPPGDLYVQVNVRPHPFFTREGVDLHSEVPISFVTASLGGELDVPTLDGKVKLRIPPETQTGKVFRLRGKGVTSVRGGAPGDLLCKVVVETPVSLNQRQKDILLEFERSMTENSDQHSPRARSWLEGVKKFFEEMRF